MTNQIEELVSLDHDSYPQHGDAVFPRGVPFILFEDARSPCGGVRLFSGPREIVRADVLRDVEPGLAAVRAGLKRGLHAAGWLTYEAGFAFEPRLRAQVERGHATPLIWFGLFENATQMSRAALTAALPSPDGAWVSAPRPRVTRLEYEAAFNRVRRYIVAGDAYQVNLSYRADVTLLGDPLAVYARLRDIGGGGWSGVAFDGENWLLSTSPELFFRLADGGIEAKPMKGTAKRNADAEQDRRAAEALRSDPKERAENLMIVDLLRNDISRLAERGSVHVPELFVVETYPTLHTLTSTVRARLQEGCDAIDALHRLFPCGSVTGAPKIRAMEIIAELECDARGPYTGSLGWMSPEGVAEFNVAIRTLCVESDHAAIGLGSAVVYDSTPADEWEECRAKGAFLTANAPVFELVETMRFDPGAGIRLLDLHLARLCNAAGVFGYTFDEGGIRAALANSLALAREAYVVRLLLSANGAAKIELRDVPAFPHDGMRVAFSPLPTTKLDFRLRYKTTLRGFYDAARAARGAEEVVFFDPDGLVTEGSFSNVFVERKGVLLTPPVTRGLLPGVLRASLLADGRARECDLRIEDLGEDFLLGNAVRGLIPARLCAPNALAFSSSP